jgi:hypothetical protein
VNPHLSPISIRGYAESAAKGPLLRGAILLLPIFPVCLGHWCIAI